jgi:tetratricopeptide (TPR) repeat protein
LANGLYGGYVLNTLWEQAGRLGQLLLTTRPEPEARPPYLAVLGDGVIANAMRGAPREASAFLARLLEFSAEAPLDVPLERAWSAAAQGIFSVFLETRLWQACLWLEEACQGFAAMGLERHMLGPQVHRAQALEALGDRAGAELQFRQSLGLARQLEHPLLGVYAESHFALFLASSSEPAQRQEALALANGPEIEHIHLFAGMRDTRRAQLALAAGDLSEAERQARKACERLATFFFYQLRPRVLLSQVLLTQGRATEAREVVAPGVREFETLGGMGLHAVSVYLAMAEACLADGDIQEGEAALRKAVQCVRNRAKDIPDEAARQRFLRQVPENARTLELARQRWGEAEIR